MAKISYPKKEYFNAGGMGVRHKNGCIVDSECSPEYMQYIMEQALNSMGEICIVDESGRYVCVSDTYAKNMGIDAEDAMGRPILDIIPDSDIPNVLESGRSTKSTIYQHNGRSFWLNRFPIKDGDKIVGVVGQALGMEDHATGHIERQLEQTVRELNYYKGKVNQEQSSHLPVDAIVAKSESMVELKKSLTNVARTRSTVLITGESGTGKEVVSCAIHDLSPRRNMPFIRINCAAIPENLFEAELFGYEEGSFTGALKGGKMGDLEAANGGTVLLDEVDSLTLNMQSKLLRVLQEREIKKVGSNRSTPIDVRFIFATNKDLTSLMKEGKFRADFYYRINVISILIPPLRERTEDIPPLVESFIKKFNAELDMNIKGITPAALAMLQSYKWPGNIRELQNQVERAFNYCTGDMLDTADFRNAGLPVEDKAENFPMSLKEIRQKAERQAIINALQITKGNKKEAAALLKIDRSLLYDKIRLYGIDK